MCVGYETPEGRSDSFPVDDVASARPIYETLPGFGGDLAGARSMSDLPASAREYVAFIERATGCPVVLVSVGPARDETIVLKDVFAD